MNLLEFNFSNIEQVLIFYKSKTLKDLQIIKPKWAYGPNIKEVFT
ncbi:hypothetical protein SAMN05443669_101468 [Flavobacterium xanthum]|uniref:Uncharacterized protein n=1 Tax=Flavobacterium xanthum TaxID=69322 RepID=A0A1M7DR35_9FLAO|nr:hypothetical protein SAMN05443669_101468 [Flavobacterium xanthum]